MPFPFNLQLEENKIDQDATAVAVGGNGDGNTTANAGNKADIDSNDDLTSTVDYGSYYGDSHFPWLPSGNVQAESNVIDQDATAVAVGGNGDGNTTANAFNDASIDSNDDLTSTVDYHGFDFMAPM